MKKKKPQQFSFPLSPPPICLMLLTVYFFTLLDSTSFLLLRFGLFQRLWIQTSPPHGVLLGLLHVLDILILVECAKVRFLSASLALALLLGRLVFRLGILIGCDGCLVNDLLIARSSSVAVLLTGSTNGIERRRANLLEFGNVETVNVVGMGVEPASELEAGVELLAHVAGEALLAKGNASVDQLYVGTTRQSVGNNTLADRRIKVRNPLELLRLMQESRDLLFLDSDTACRVDKEATSLASMVD